MKEINLSFIITTRNRLDYLKVVIDDLIATKQRDEELIVIDALSNDGTSEFLKDLLFCGKIDKLLIEADRCQAEGWNKGFLLSEGVLIKKITDDDVFDFTAIRKCKDFMLTNRNIDVCISNELFTDNYIYPNYNKHSFFDSFIRWKNNEICSFFFSDPHMLIRRECLSHIGLFNPRFIMIDYEYSLRISFLKSSIAYFSGYNSMSFFRQETVSGLIKDSILYNEYKVTDKLYNYTENEHLHLKPQFKAMKWLKQKFQKNKKLNTKQLSNCISFYEKYHFMKSKLAEINGSETKFTTNV